MIYVTEATIIGTYAAAEVGEVTHAHSKLYLVDKVVYDRNPKYSYIYYTYYMFMIIVYIILIPPPGGVQKLDLSVR